MEPPLSSLVLVVFGLLISVFSLRVDSQPPGDGSTSRKHPPPPSPSPPHPPSPPPSPPPPLPPPPSPPPPPPRPPPSSPPPPPSPFSSPAPPAQGPAKQPNAKSELNRNRSAHLPPPSPHSKSSHQGRNSPPRRNPPPPRRKSKINAGKKVGLMFSGIAAILQIGVISFLVFKRRQLLKVTNRYETCS